MTGTGDPHVNLILLGFMEEELGRPVSIDEYARVMEILGDSLDEALLYGNGIKEKEVKP